jgi:hypothetical protein
LEVAKVYPVSMIANIERSVGVVIPSSIRLNGIVPVAHSAAQAEPPVLLVGV